MNLNMPVTVSSPRGAKNAKKRRRLSKTDMREVEGLRLGRYPFAGAIPYYLERRVGIVMDSTYREEERKLKYLSRVFEDLKAQGKISSTDPRKISRKGIQEFLVWMKRTGLDPVAQAKYMQYLNNFLKAFKNLIIEEMKADGVRFPKPTRKPVRVIAEEDLRLIFETVNDMEGWHGSVSRGMTALYFATGVRPKELRLAHHEDLDLKKTRTSLYVRHPKGEGSWASPEYVDLIRGDMLPGIRRYLVERREHVVSKGLRKATALFPNLYRGQDEFYSPNAFNVIKRKVEDLSGVSFKLKDFRSTLTSITVNGDLSRLPAMSVQLRHAKMETTQKYYVSIEKGVASRQLRDAWKENPVIVQKTPLIDSDFDNTGYM